MVFLLALVACVREVPCRPRTVLLTVDLGDWAPEIAVLEFRLAVDGGQTWTAQGETRERKSPLSIELPLGDRYPSKGGSLLDLGMRGHVADGRVLTAWVSQTLVLAETCTPWPGLVRLSAEDALPRDAGAGLDEGPRDAPVAVDATPDATDATDAHDAALTFDVADTTTDAGSDAAIDADNDARPDQQPTQPPFSICRRYTHYDNTGCTPPKVTNNFGVRAIAFAPSGDLMATSGEDGVVKIWAVDALGLTPAGRLFRTNTMEDLAFSPDGAYLAGTGRRGLTNLWRMNDGVPEISKLHAEEHTGYWAFFSGTSDRFLTAHYEDSSLHLWSTRDRLFAELPVPFVNDLAVSRASANGGPWWALVTDMEGKAVFLDVNAAQPTPTPPFDLGILRSRPFDVSPDGNTVAAWNEDGVYLWDVRDKAAPRRYEQPLRPARDIREVEALKFSPSGKYLAVLLEGGSSTYTIYALPSGLTVASGDTDHLSLTVAFSPDERAVAIGVQHCGVIIHCHD